MWAEQGVPEILELDPMLLAFKNGYGDSVLMSLVAASTGMYTETIDYDMIKRILDNDYTYEDVDKDEEGNEVVVEKNALNEVDINGQTPIDFLIDFAYATGSYKGMQPDEQIQYILKEFASDGDSEEVEEKLPEENDIEEISESYEY